MTARVCIFRFEGEDERVYTLEKQLLDAPRLRLDPLLETLLVGAVFDDETAFVERLRNPGAHFVQMKRLRDVIERAHLQAGDRTLHFGNGGHYDNGRFRPARDDLAQQRHTVHFRHAQVGDDERHRSLLELLQCFDSGAGLGAREAFALEQPDEHTPQPRLVVDDEAAHSGEGWHRPPKV